MTAALVPDDFSSLAEPLGLDVRVANASVPVFLHVDTVTSLPAHRLRPEPFSLVLRGPAAPFLPQGTYALRHPRLGPIELFLVPIGRDAQTTRYEATFN